MKRTTKLVSVLLAVLLAFSSFAVLPTFAYEHSSKAPGSQYEFGDVNRDGVIDIVDATLVQKKAADKAVFDDEQKILGDVNGDGEVDILDATLIQKFVVDRIDKFPVEEIVPTEPTDEPTTAKLTDEPTEPAPEGAYYILGTMNNWSIDEDYMLTANEAAEGEYMFEGLNLTTSDQFKIGYSENGAEPKVWYPDGYNSNYGQNGEIKADGTYDVYFRPDGQGGEDWFYNCIYVTAAAEQPTDEPDTTAEPTEPAPEGAYYILGTMNNWSVDENYMLAANEAAEGEYMFTGLELKTTDQFKVVYSEGGAEPKVWYPDGMGNNYGENGEITADGVYTVYFNPLYNGGEDWFYNCIYVAAEEQPTDEPGTTAEPTEPGTTAEPTEPAPEGAYYIVGTMTNWAVDADYQLTANEAAEGEYMFTGLELTTSDQFKVVYSADGTALTTWYPDGMGNNYGENGEIKADGTYDVYFRPDGQGGEDWFYNCIYVAAKEQPTDEPGTTAEPTEPGTTAEPGDVVYSVAGSSADIFGATWDASYKGTEMTKGADGVYSITFEDVQPANEVQFKIVKDHSWDVSYPAENYLFNVVTACDVTITFDPATETVKATGAGVVIPGDLDVYSVIAVGNGEETYLNGANWEPANTDNAMTEIADGIWEFTMEDIYAFDNYNIKFAVNSVDEQGNPTSNPWAHNFGSAEEKIYPTGEAIDAVYNGKNCIFEVEEDGSTVKLQLDLRNFDFTSKQGAKMTITVTAPEEPVTRPTTEPGTTAEPGAEGYYIVGTMTDWAINEDYALTANEASEGEYVFTGLNLTTTDQFKVVYSKDGTALTTWYPDGMGNNYGENGEIKADGTYDVYFRPDGQGGEDWFYNCIYVAAKEQPTDEPGTTAEPTEPGTTAEPGAEGYYIVGTMTDWAINEDYALTANEASEGEYVFTGLNLTTTDQFKVVYSADGTALTTWYPDGMGNNYGENGEIKADGTYDVYFRPDGQGGEDWFYNCIYVAGEEQPTDEPGTTAEPTEPGTTAEPGAEGYYIVGTMTDWAINEDYALTANEASEGEYMFKDLELTTDDQFKVVYSKDGTALTTWYPDGMGNNYGENGEIKADGTYDVYFRPDGQGGEDWFYNCIYVAGEEQPTDEPGTTEPGTTEEPTGEPADAVYSVAGSSADIFGATWDASYKGTEMTKGADGIYSITFEDVQPANEVQFKIVKDHSWDVSYPAENYLFNVVTACDVTITFDPATETVKATGAGVVIPGDLDVYSVIAVGNGEETYLNGANWEPANTDNAMTEIADGIWEFTMEDIYAFDNYNIKFTVNSVDEQGNPTSNPWAHNFGSAEEKIYPTGEAIDAVYNGKNCIFEVEEDGSTVKLQLDLRNFDFTSKQGAKMTITVTAPEEPETKPTAEPTEPETKEPTEPSNGGYFIVGTMTNWAIDDNYRLAPNDGVEYDEYMFSGLNLTTTDQFKVVYSADGTALTTWYPDGMGNNYGENGEITADGTYDVYFRPDGQGGEDWFYNCIYVAAKEQPTDEPGTTAEPTEPGTTAEPTEPAPEGAYYIVGTMTNWAVDADYQLTANEAAEGEYVFTGLNLTTTDQFKVVYSADGTAMTTWYPDGMGNNYGENGEIKADGTYDVYFRPDGQGGEDWFYNCIYVAAKEQPTDEPGTTAEPTEPDTNEPTEPSNGGYFIVGTMTNWAVDDNYRLAPNDGVEYDEYMFSGLNLTTTDQFKVVYSADGTAMTTWYPDGMGNNYGENGEITANGTYDVYFRPDGQGGEDWFYNCIYVAGEEQPTDEPGTTAEPTEPGTTEEPTGEPADAVYSVAGSSADIFGATWDASYKGTEMTKGADGVYSITFEDVQPANEVQFKVVKDHGWDVSYPAENYLFNVVTACDVTITFDPATETVKATGAGVVIPGALDVYSVIAVGNGEETYLNGANWEPANTDNAMTEIADGIWEFTMEDIYAFDNYNIKFAVNSVDEQGNPTSNPWAHNFGSAVEKLYPTGEALDAVYNGKNCIFEVEEDGSTVKLQLDLRNFDFETKQGAKMTITVTAPEEPETKPTAEPTEPETKEPTEPSNGGYFIVGTMTNWAIDDNYRLAPNDGVDYDEYMFSGLNLTTTDQFKVVYSADGTALTTWYPDGMGNNYGENGEIKADGTYDVYFRPDGQGGEDWFYNCIYVAAKEQPTEPATNEPTEPVTNEPTEPATNEPTEPAETIAVYFTDAQNFGDVHVYYWPNGGDWPGVAAVEKETNDFGQKVYQATVPADVNGIIFNGNGKQTVDITRGIEDGAWWYTLDTQEDGKYNVELVNASTDPTDPTEPATNEPTDPTDPTDPTEPTTEEPAAEDVYSVAGSSADIFGSAWDAEGTTNEMTKGADGVYSITFENVQPESNVEYKVVKNHNWDTAYPAQNATFTVTAVSDVTITFDPATSAVNATVTPTEEPEPEPQGTVVKLKPNSNWTQDNARFAVYVFNKSTGKNDWADMTAVGDGTYTVTLPEGTWEKVIFVRMNPNTTVNNWDNKWNQSADLVITANKLYEVPAGAWDGWTA